MNTTTKTYAELREGDVLTTATTTGKVVRKYRDTLTGRNVIEVWDNRRGRVLLRSKNPETDTFEVTASPTMNTTTITAGTRAAYYPAADELEARPTFGPAYTMGTVEGQSAGGWVVRLDDGRTVIASDDQLEVSPEATRPVPPTPARTLHGTAPISYRLEAIAAPRDVANAAVYIDREGDTSRHPAGYLLFTDEGVYGAATINQLADWDTKAIHGPGLARDIVVELIIDRAGYAAMVVDLDAKAAS